jgi:16S rRNA (adenine1518-N6/adenine1519-N6)-dimethyltransferase
MVRSHPIANKHLGQHFLINEDVQQRIIEACQLKPHENIVEIGPGLGALTSHLLKRVRHVFAVETDPRMIQALRERFAGRITPKNLTQMQAETHAGLTLIPSDILRWKLSQLTVPVKVIGNLPYHISTPIVEWLIDWRSRVEDCFLTVQWEFGQRLAADCNSKAYGALSCFVQYYADVQILFKIRNTAFRPIPQVTSCFCHLRFRNPAPAALNEEFLFTIIRQAFQQRRKKITNALAPKINAETLTHILTDLTLSPDLRAENISLQDYIRIANSFYLIGGKRGVL